ncbi:MAG: glycosyltransferase [Ignavibacteria bacterium]|nr:glycosyltransferase [Ignavibacteria bacterium]
MRIIIIGPYPPPYGGISIHCQRLYNYLKNYGYDIKFYDDYLLPKMSFLVLLINYVRNKKNDTSPNIFKQTEAIDYESLNGFLKLFCRLILFERKSGTIIHFHKKNWKYRALICLASKINRNLNIIFTLHSLREEIEKVPYLTNLYIKYIFKSNSRYIAVSEEIKRKIIKWGATEKKIAVIPAFLPPFIDQEDIKKIHGKIWEFLEKKSPIISANASKIQFFNNQDLYGLDISIELCSELVKKIPDLGFIFCLSDKGDEEYFNKLQQRIDDLKIRENFLFITNSLPFYPILMKSDVFIRPTNTDGDALSIREALYFKIQVISSDVVERPEGVILFRNRDLSDLVLKTMDILDKQEENKRMYQKENYENNVDKIIKEYDKLVSNNRN